MTNFLINLEFCSSPHNALDEKYTSIILTTEQKLENLLVTGVALELINVIKLTTAASITGILAIDIELIVVINDFLFSLFIKYTIPDKTNTFTTGAIVYFIILNILSTAKLPVQLYIVPLFLNSVASLEKILP